VFACSPATILFLSFHSSISTRVVPEQEAFGPSKLVILFRKVVGEKPGKNNTFARHERYKGSSKRYQAHLNLCKFN
jgi:hypothetical protein